MKKFVFLLFCILGLSVYAQDSRGFVSCNVQTKDSLTQGKQFYVKYVLTATNWKNAHIETTYPFICKSTEHDVQESKKGTLKRLIVHAYFVCPKTGAVELPRLSAIVGGKTYYSQAKTVYLHPHSQWAEEYEMGANWLQKHGVDSVLLEPGTKWDELTVFNDKQRGAFVVMASKNYRQYLSNPILAYGTESHFEVNDGTRTLINNLAHQLQRIKDRKGYHRPLPAATTNVQPLLGKTAWGQDEPYNTYTPMVDTIHCLTGCVPTAVAQLLRYHAPTFNDKQQPDWTTMRDAYTKEEGAEAKEVAKLMSQIGRGVRTNYGMEESSSTLLNVKGLLLFQMGCSGKMQYIQQMSDSLKVNLIQSELSKQRPVLASNSKHCYVIDGCEGEYLHYNFGWKGMCNGYFRIPFCATTDHAKVWDLREMVVGIQKAGEDREKTVVLKKPGELANLLTDEEKATITSLHVEGKLNSQDVRLLRRMAGAMDNSQNWEWEGGTLAYLDLQNASFVTDKANFYGQTRMLGSITYTQFINDEFGTSKAYDKYFDLGKPLSDQMWKNLEIHVGTKGNGYELSRDDARLCWMNQHTQKGIISPYMFFLCTSLRHIELPNDVTMIEFGAFAGCSSLQSVVIGKKVNNVDSHAFSYCPYLTTITFTSKIVWCGPNFEECPLLVNKPQITSSRRSKFTTLTWD